MIPNRATWVEINTSALAHNIYVYKKIAGQGITLAAVVKGNAYGHGLIETAQALQQNNDISWVCTSTLSEALLLRNQNISKPVLVLGCLDTDPTHISGKKISLTVHDETTANLLSKTSKKIGEPIHVHIKIDTGLSRIGVLPTQAVSFIKKVKALPGLVIDGAFTHASSLRYGRAILGESQTKKFVAILEKIKNENLTPPMVHAHSSSTAYLIEKINCNFLRLGSGIYGLRPHAIEKPAIDSENNLTPALTWKTKIMSVKEINSGSDVGYGGTYRTKERTRIAVLPIGYCEGYPRSLSNKGHVLINNKFAPVIGAISMNMTVVDVGKIKNVNVGDTATLIGNIPGIKPWEVAKTAGIISSELVSRISPTITRMLVN